MGEGPPLWLIGITVATYFAFIVGFGDSIFDTDFADGFSFGDLEDVIHDLGNLVTLGGIDSPIPGVMQVVLVLVIGLPWLFYILRALQMAIPGGA